MEENERICSEGYIGAGADIQSLLGEFTGRKENRQFRDVDVIDFVAGEYFNGVKVRRFLHMVQLVAQAYTRSGPSATFVLHN